MIYARKQIFGKGKVKWTLSLIEQVFLLTASYSCSLINLLNNFSSSDSSVIGTPFYLMEYVEGKIFKVKKYYSKAITKSTFT